MRISDWSSDVCSSDLDRTGHGLDVFAIPFKIWRLTGGEANQQLFDAFVARGLFLGRTKILQENEDHEVIVTHYGLGHVLWSTEQRSEEHTSELQSLMRISYDVFCLKKKNNYIKSNKQL